MKEKVLKENSIKLEFAVHISILTLDLIAGAFIENFEKYFEKNEHTYFA